MKKVNSIRKVKKLLKLYPPIVEICLTKKELDSFTDYRRNSLLLEFKKLTNVKIITIIRQIEEPLPAIINIKPDIDFDTEKFLEEMKNFRSNIMSASDAGKTQMLEVKEIQRVKIYTFFKSDFENLYLKKFNEYVKNLKDEIQN